MHINSNKYRWSGNFLLAYKKSLKNVLMHFVFAINSIIITAVLDLSYKNYG